MSMRAVALGVAGGAIVLASAYYTGRMHEGEELEAIHRAEVAQLRGDLEQRLAAAQKTAREAEQKAALAVSEIEAKHHAEIEAARGDLARLDADLRAGAARLRERFTCAPAVARGGATEAATGSGQRHAAAPGGLSPADAEFLVRLAGEADAVAHQLAACQAIVRADRGQ